MRTSATMHCISPGLPTWWTSAIRAAPPCVCKAPFPILDGVSEVPPIPSTRLSNKKVLMFSQALLACHALDDVQDSKVWTAMGVKVGFVDAVIGGCTRDSCLCYFRERLTAYGWSACTVFVARYLLRVT